MEIEKKVFDNGNIYLSCHLLSYGDYDNSGSIERANVKFLQEKYPEYRRISLGLWERGETWEGVKILPKSKIIELYGSFNHHQIWIREDIAEKEEYFESLVNYPVLNDEKVYEIEAEMEAENWKLWIKEELIKTLPKKWQEIDWQEEELWEAYQKAKEEESEYFYVESGGIGYINIDKIKSTFKNLLNKKRSEDD